MTSYKFIRIGIDNHHYTRRPPALIGKSARSCTSRLGGFKVCIQENVLICISFAIPCLMRCTFCTFIIRYFCDMCTPRVGKNDSYRRGQRFLGPLLTSTPDLKSIMCRISMTGGLVFKRKCWCCICYALLGEMTHLKLC